MMKKSFKLMLMLFLVLVIGSTSVFANSYWRVLGWTPNPNVGVTDEAAVLTPADCMITTPGYGWYEVHGTMDPIYILIRYDDPHFNNWSSSWVFYYYGQGSNGKPLIGCDIIVGIGGNGTAYLNPTPPCMEWTPSAYTINGNAKSSLNVNYTSPIIMDARNAYSTNNAYFVSVQLSDKYWNRYGVEIMQWMTPGTAPYYFNISGFDIRNFCQLKNFTLQKGQYYRIKLAVNPWHETSKLVYMYDPNTAIAIEQPRTDER